MVLLHTVHSIHSPRPQVRGLSHFQAGTQTTTVSRHPDRLPQRPQTFSSVNEFLKLAELPPTSPIAAQVKQATAW
jgi:hypothetical protein